MKWLWAMPLGVVLSSVEAEPRFAPQAMAPIDIGVVPRAAQCGQCHTRIHDEWQRSMHRQSLSSPVFLDGLASEPHPRCIHCHVPLANQTRDVMRQFRSIVSTASVSSLPATSTAHEGITCATCHVRDGDILTGATPLHAYGHAVRAAPLLKDPAFCARCHEFKAHEVHNGTTVLTDAPMQTTYSEWQAYRAAGGEKTCQDCHMPGGAHTFPGAHDIAFLKRALDVTVQRSRDGITVEVASRDVGHAFPTGDVFRHLSLWADGEKIAHLGRRYEVSVAEDGMGHVTLAEDTSLQPFVPQRFTLPPTTKTLHITYHYAAERHERRGTLPRSSLVVTLWEFDCNAPVKEARR